ncbi:MAG: hypothetical protein HYR74_12350 [Candidatus Eisenbacteria bacterium]|nr:hypothetical protein [Candidatus Eisenbacteria bacterium]
MRTAARRAAAIAIVAACAVAVVPAAGASSAVAAPAPSLAIAPATEPGRRLVVEGTVVDDRGRPVPQVRLYVYQTDATGAYTRTRAMDEPHARLSGRIETDSAGRFELRTIRPGAYRTALELGGRMRHIPAHIHMYTQAAGFAERRLQAVFADDTLLADPYWADWVRRLGQPVLAVSVRGDTTVAALRIVLHRPPAPR